MCTAMMAIKGQERQGTEIASSILIQESACKHAYSGVKRTIHAKLHFQQCQELASDVDLQR